MKITVTALMSDSCPVKVCLHCPSRMSQSLALASQAPDRNTRLSGNRDRNMTSPVWLANCVTSVLFSMSQRPLHTNLSSIMTRRSSQIRNASKQKLLWSTFYPENKCLLKKPDTNAFWYSKNIRLFLGQGAYVTYIYKGFPIFFQYHLFISWIFLIEILHVVIN